MWQQPEDAPNGGVEQRGMGRAASGRVFGSAAVGGVLSMLQDGRFVVFKKNNYINYRSVLDS